MNEQIEHAIAIIGLSGRFPGAENIEEFWQNLIHSRESITVFSEDELRLAKISNELLSNPNYVKARGVLNNIEFFDAHFFDFTTKEAELTDPQHRVFLECAWEALENSGYASDDYSGSIGVYAGTGNSTYFLNNILPNLTNNTLVDYLQHIGNDKDFLTTKVSYKLNLKGPSIAIQSACSTSLVAISMACKELLTYQCDIALAGGASISVPQINGYMYMQDMIYSPDGHCRPLDAKAQGTVPSNGVGIVVLKRLDDAIQDRDHIYAVIRGCGINNDGMRKIGYSAPSIQGQADAISAAFSMANINADSITYVEAHGTGTLLGDLIEIKALTTAFQMHTEKKQFAAIGSIKSNIGHLIETSGVAGLIKTCLSLYHQKLLPTLHCENPNPNIDFKNSPFYVNTKLTEWTTDKLPRRACVSSFGFGGTNAHVILEEADKTNTTTSKRPFYLIVLSGKSKSALHTASRNLAKYIETIKNETCLSNIAYTLQIGRKAFPFRQAIICTNEQEAGTLLNQSPHSLNNRIYTNVVDQEKQLCITFIIPKQDTIYINTGLTLYKEEPTYTYWIDKCADLFLTYLHKDFRTALFSSEENLINTHTLLKDPQLIWASTFATSYALSQLWIEWGIQPKHVFGVGIGKIVADVLQNRFSLEQAIQQVSKFTDTQNYDIFLSLNKLLEDPTNIFLEISANNLTSSPFWTHDIVNRWIGNSLPEYSSIFSLLAQLWTMGIPINWNSFSAHEIHYRIPLPTYPFEKKRFWIDPPVITQSCTNHKSSNLQMQINHHNDTVEESLLTIWKQHFTTDNINIKSDFFKLGGDSIVALQIISDIYENLGIKLSLQTFLTHATITDLGNKIKSEQMPLISKNTKSISPLLIKLKEGSEKIPPLFCIHPISGHALCYKSLADNLQYGGSIYGIQAPSLTLENSPNLSKIETTAFYYLEAVRTVQPSGPYLLLGGSFGALVAYEMAQQLLESNQSVPLLVMLDIIRPEVLLRHIDSNTNILDLLLNLFEGSMNLDNSNNFTTEELSYRLMQSMQLNVLPIHVQKQIIEQIHLSWKALQKYHTLPYEGNVLFIEAAERFPQAQYFSCGSSWDSTYIPNLDLHILPGRHLEMLSSPIVSSLSNILDAYFLRL